MLAVGVDTGGTFTDLAYVEHGRLRVLKVPSTPEDPGQAVLMGLGLVRKGDEPVALVLGTTVATNALLTGRGARAALVTTAGFEDVLAIGRQTRSELYSLDPAAPEPIIPAPLRIGVRERMDHHGRVLERLTRAEVARIATRVARMRVEAVAVGLLHASANGAHEDRLARALARLGIPVTVASRLSPLPREYERIVLAVTNARVAPLLARHLAPLLAELGPDVRLMLCDGGARRAARVVPQAVRTILSGPAAGLRAAAALWRRAPAALRLGGWATLDVGGTSADCGLVGPTLPLSPSARVGPYPFTLPTLEVTSVGAGGGSIARLDRGGALKVGPESAGAMPGPACYGRGGTLPTVTDAFVVLGALAPDWFNGGRMVLHPHLARQAVGRLARDAGLSLPETARGIVRMATQEMVRGIRRVTLERGQDTRRLGLLAFGGAGGLFLADLMDELAFPVGIVPPAPGALSAAGALAAPRTAQAARAVHAPLAAWSPSRRRAAFRLLAAAARRDLAAEAPGAGASAAVIRTLELCFAGQSWPLEVPEDDRPGAVERRFLRAYRRRYGPRSADPTRPIELVALRARAESDGVVRRLPVLEHGSSLRPPRRASRLRREELPTGFAADGPCLVVEDTGTTRVPRGFTLRVAADGSLVLARRRR